MNEWQYGIASTKFRWNLSGTYQQVLPRYVSVDAEGIEREFLYDALGEASLGLIFLKGYQWPFDTRKIEGSSRVDLLVAAEIKNGRRVYLDFTQNPRGLENGFAVLPREAQKYLARSGALLDTPIARLEKMNVGAIALYADHGIDLYTERLEIAVCAQHCNGGVAVDAHWQSTVKGLYAVGEAAGTFGVYRPGGSALNSTQVGALRAAEHIAAQDVREILPLKYDLPPIRYGKSNISALADELRAEMSRVADFDRDSAGMQALFDKVGALLASFFDTVAADNVKQHAEMLKLYDMLLSQYAVLSAMLCSAKEQGTHGAALVDRLPLREQTPDVRVLTLGGRSHTEPVSPMPDPELWFETLLARKRGEMK
jgi:succinate dehydrogenase/fumarate reductase flavoprotein subunit